MCTSMLYCKMRIAQLSNVKNTIIVKVIKQRGNSGNNILAMLFVVSAKWTFILLGRALRVELFFVALVLVEQKKIQKLLMTADSVRFH